MILTEVFTANGLDTTRKEILLPKGLLNYKALERIIKAEGGGRGDGTGSSRGGGGGTGPS